MKEYRQAFSLPDEVPPNTYLLPGRRHRKPSLPKRRRGWAILRYQALKAANGCCQCCGNRASKDNPLQVDHIKPVSLYPELAKDLSNLQVLCKDCNQGKGNSDELDWRKK